MEVLSISVVLLWVAVLLLSLLLLALARQIGVLHERIAPLGALVLDQGPAVGEKAPIFEVKDLKGMTVRIGGAREVSQMIVFISSNCPVCKKVLPIAKQVAREEGFELILVGDEKPEGLIALAKVMGFDAVPIVNAPEVGRSFKIGKIPYAIILDTDGVIRAKGLVNSREHLESLVEAYRLGVSSIQEFLGLGKEG